MICVIEFNVTITCMVIFENKYIYVKASFACCTTDMILLVYFKNVHNLYKLHSYQ